MTAATRPNLYGPERKNGTFLCYYSQTTSEDAYERVGEQDMTAHVDFTALAQANRVAGLELTDNESMSFLIGLGARQFLGTAAGIGRFMPPSTLATGRDGADVQVLVQHRAWIRQALGRLKFKPFFGSILRTRTGRHPSILDLRTLARTTLRSWSVMGNEAAPLNCPILIFRCGRAVQILLRTYYRPAYQRQTRAPKAAAVVLRRKGAVSIRYYIIAMLFVIFDIQSCSRVSLGRGVQSWG